MNPLYAPLYAHVMVLYWPRLWWQLRAIERWRQQAGRGLLIAADAYGTVQVRWVEDAPAKAIVRAPVSGLLACSLSGPGAPLWGPARLSVQAGLAARGPRLRREGLPLPNT